jgi:tetratricopeptide (TPR) repeat protein
MSIRQRLLAAAVACATAIAAPALAQSPSLESGIALYAAASYDEALEAFEGARQGRLSPGDRAELERHRMLCLLALGRTAAAADAAVELLEQQPDYWLSETQAAPHVRAMLEATRSQVVPGLMRRTYDGGKRAYDSGDYAAARDAFTRLDQWLADAHVTAVDPSLADLRTLARGFLELSAARAARPANGPVGPAPPARPPVAPTVGTTRLVAASAVSAPFTPLDFLVYDARDRDVLPPQALSQRVRGWWETAAGEPPAGTPLGEVAVVIDSTGRVVEASIERSVNRLYDTLLLESSKQWRYQPARLRDRPVRYRQVVSAVSGW